MRKQFYMQEYKEMGIDINTSKFFISAYEDGIKFGKTLTLGRQNLYVSPAEAIALKSELQRLNPEKAYDVEPKGLAESIFKAFESDEVLAMDKSDFEGADLLHDMNFPIPESYKEQFDLLYDGGTLEHIFNFPTAIKNAMEMVKVGGHLVIQTPTNNWSGHGFYQFSPELYYRTLSEVNGFRVKRMVVFEWGQNKWYEVSDPLSVASRIYVVNGCRTSLLILAERVAMAEINQNPPQQSDYAFAKWGMAQSAEVPAKEPVLVAGAQQRVEQKSQNREASQEATQASGERWATAKSLLPRRLINVVKAAIGHEAVEQDYFSRHPKFFKAVDR